MQTEQTFEIIDTTAKSAGIEQNPSQSVEEYILPIGLSSQLVLDSYELALKECEEYKAEGNKDELSDWKRASDQFYNIMKEKNYRFYIQERESSKLIHLSMLNKNSAYLKANILRAILYDYRGNRSITLNTETKQIVQLFAETNIEFEQYELEDFETHILFWVNEMIKEEQNTDSSVELTPCYEIREIPVGITVQVNYFNENWNIGTINNMTVNQGKTIANRTLFQIFEQLLQKHDLSINDLNKKSSYTFVLNTADLQVIPSSDYIYLRSVQTDSENITDKIIESIPSLKKLSVKCDHLGVPILPKNYFENSQNTANQPTEYVEIKWTNKPLASELNPCCLVRTDLHKVLRYIRNPVNGVPNEQEQKKRLHFFARNPKSAENTYVQWFNMKFTQKRVVRDALQRETRSNNFRSTTNTRNHFVSNNQRSTTNVRNHFISNNQRQSFSKVRGNQQNYRQHSLNQPMRTQVNQRDNRRENDDSGRSRNTTYQDFNNVRRSSNQQNRNGRAFDNSRQFNQDSRSHSQLFLERNFSKFLCNEIKINSGLYQSQIKNQKFNKSIVNSSEIQQQKLAVVPETKIEHRSKTVSRVQPVRHIKQEQVESLMFKCINFNQCQREFTTKGGCTRHMNSCNAKLNKSAPNDQQE